jgi:hypothetical protein
MFSANIDSSALCLSACGGRGTCDASQKFQLSYRPVLDILAANQTCYSDAFSFGTSSLFLVSVHCNNDEET